jgi:drug/metabolite transporter (DMT)-like permease
MQQQHKALLYTLTAVLLWSTVAVPFKIGLTHFHYLHFLFVTLSIAVMVMFFTLVFQKKLALIKNLTRKDWFIGIIGGMLNPFLYYLMLFKAYSILPAQIAQALNYTWPIMLVLLSVPFLGQRLNLKGFSTLLIGFAGVYLIASQGQLWPIQPAQPLGVLLAISTSLVWAVFWIINTKSKVDSGVNLFINFATGWLLTLPLIFTVSWNYAIPFNNWIAVAYSGVFEMGITFVIWLTAMKLTSRTDRISNYVFLSPFLSLFFIRLFLKEQIYDTTLIGLVLIIASIFLNKWVSKTQ